METDRTAFGGGPAAPPNPQADPLSAPACGNRPAEHARQIRPSELAGGRNFQVKPGAVDFLGLSQELGPAAIPPAQAEPDGSWLMQVADEALPEAPPEEPMPAEAEPELGPQTESAYEVEPATPVAGPNLYNAAWNEQRERKPRRFVVPVAAGATAALLALAAVPFLRSESRSDEKVPLRSESAPATTARAEPAAPLDDAREEPEVAAPIAVSEPATPPLDESTAVLESAPEPELTPPEGSRRAVVASGAPEREDPFEVVRESTPEISSSPAGPEPALEAAVSPLAAEAPVESSPVEWLAPVELAPAPAPEPAPVTPAELPVESQAETVPPLSIAEPAPAATVPAVFVTGPSEMPAPPGSAPAFVGPPAPDASSASAGEPTAGRTSRLRIEDVLLLGNEGSALRTASAQDLQGVWSAATIPVESIGAATKLLTPQVGKVRVTVNGGELFEGTLYAVGEGCVWIDTRYGRMGLAGARVTSIAQIDTPPGSPPLGAPGSQDAAGLERVRVRTPGGVLYGKVLHRDAQKTTLITDDGARLTLDSKDVELLSEAPRITLKKD